MNILDIDEECANKKCKWVGTTREKDQKPHRTRKQVFIYVCPKCGNHEFYEVKNVDSD